MREIKNPITTQTETQFFSSGQFNELFQAREALSSLGSQQQKNSLVFHGIKPDKLEVGGDLTNNIVVGQL